MMPSMTMLLWLGLSTIPTILGLCVHPEATVFGTSLRAALTTLGIWSTAGVVVFSIVDVVRSPSMSRILAEREIGDVMSVGARNAVRIKLRNQNSQSVVVAVHDEPPMPGDISDLPFHIELPPNRGRYFVYHFTPHRRGKNRFGRLFLQARSRYGFWTLCSERRDSQPKEIRIYPDIQSVHAIELLARRNRLAEAGVKMSRLRGRGNDFDRLREYQREDEFRSIDWKATSRCQGLITREYVIERNQNVLFLLDSGRSMCNEIGGISHFDRALNSILMLSYVALRQGDTVGLMCCSNQVDRWVPPIRGRSAIQTLIRHTYDIEPSYHATDYNLLVEQLRQRYRKRSLVILVTHALDEVHLTSISRVMRELKSPHLVLGAFLRNVELFERLNQIPETDLQAFQVAAAADMLGTQTLQIASLQASGLMVLDVLPDELTGNLVSRYLDIKARHLL